MWAERAGTVTLDSASNGRGAVAIERGLIRVESSSSD